MMQHCSLHPAAVGHHFHCWVCVWEKEEAERAITPTTKQLWFERGGAWRKDKKNDSRDCCVGSVELQFLVSKRESCFVLCLKWLMMFLINERAFVMLLKSRSIYRLFEISTCLCRNLVEIFSRLMLTTMHSIFSTKQFSWRYVALYHRWTIPADF